MKTLKMRRIFAYVIYNSLRGIAPKNYPTTGEIKSTISAILPALKAQVSEYLVMHDKAGDLAEKMASKQITEEESKATMDEYNETYRTYNKEHGQEIVDISLDAESLKILKAQFERDGWGATWIANIEEYGEITTAFEEAI